MESLMPTSWTDLSMDWTTPDGTNPVYLRAIEMAIMERESVLGLYQGDDAYRMNSGDVFNGDWAHEIAVEIEKLFGYFLVADTSTTIADKDYYVSGDDILGNDSNLADLSVQYGDLLKSTITANFLKACKYFLDKLTITSMASGSRSSTTTNSYFIMDYSYSDPPTLPDPYVPTYGNYWDACANDLTFEADTESSWVGVFFGFNNYFSVRYARMGWISNVRYHSVHKQAHNILLFVSEEYLLAMPANNVFHDFNNFGFAEGWSTAKEIPVDSPDNPDVNLGGGTLTKPATWPDEADWTQYAWSYKATGILDFGVANGFAFRP